MTPDLTKAFLTNYLLSLKERTRDEVNGTKWGIDWAVYNLGQAIYGKPIRLPFLRQSDGVGVKSKPEAEFGVDVSFLSSDKKVLTIFVLKDEPLTNRTWVGNGFHEDLAKAITPDLAASGLELVERVEVVLAHNRDEQANGVTLFDNFVKCAPPMLAGRAELSIVRWNLSDLVDLTLQHVLTPALLPQRFFGQLNYLCAQFADFQHGSDAWEQQLVPGWKRFVGDVMAEEHGNRGAALLPIALIILREHGHANPSLETGWLDLIEWAAIAMWRRFTETTDKVMRTRVVLFWQQFYLEEISRFYRKHIDALATENSIDSLAGSSMVGVAASSVVAYWHLGRLGLLSLGLAESMRDKTKKEREERHRILHEISNWIIRLFNANQATFRPLLDIHHIEIALVAFALSNADRLEEFGLIISTLIERLYLRRIEFGEIPFLDGYNSLENVLEQVAGNNEEKLITTQSSFFVLMLMEFCCLLAHETRDHCLPIIHRRLVLGAMDRGPQRKIEALHLMSWIPPSEWDKKVLRGPVEDGESVTRGPLSDEVDAPASELVEVMTHFVGQMRAAAEFPNEFSAPLSSLILASIRHCSPLPPEIWRASAFPQEKKSDRDSDQSDRKNI